MRLYYRDDSTHLSIILSAAAILVIGLTATTMHQPTQVQAQCGPSGCPDPGQCTCNTASRVMTDHAMQAPFNGINNGCTESGWF
ncbi:MAG: hypothetical protein M3044_03905 [Thermoproteota archaeon]|nr:hypothetical protein [Thermoproteota archaeon]